MRTLHKVSQNYALLLLMSIVADRLLKEGQFERNSHLSLVVNLVLGLTFPLPATVMQSKGPTFKVDVK